jgi:anaerobic magnesium-protoporphyrin IX monomethyl ester cyclase
VRKRGHEVKIIELRREKDPISVAAKSINNFQADIAIINLTTTSFTEDIKFIQAFSSQIPFVAFGTHALAYPDEFFYAGGNAILVGDPEAALINLIEGKTEGVWRKGTSRPNPVYLENLDNLGSPAIDLLNLSNYSAPFIKERKFFICLSSRGCPYKCNYCLYPVFFGKKLRQKTATAVVKELTELYEKYGIKEIYFLDATFNLNLKWLNEFCLEMSRKALPVRWSCNIRADNCTKTILEKMRIAGCNRVFIGVEDPDLYNDMHKDITFASTVNCFRSAKSVGIKTVAFLMLFPRPELTEKKYILKALNLIKFLEADAFQCNIVIPFPGTVLFKEMAKKNRLIFDWSLFDPLGDAIPFQASPNLVVVRNKVYKLFPLKHPIKAMKIFFDMSLLSQLRIIKKLYFFLR